jgi:hypothetical protein
MSFTISLGNGTRAAGFACISVGDGADTRGAFQVDVQSKLTLPSMTRDQAQEIVDSLLDMLSTYEAFERQGFAPAGFAEKAKYAIDFGITVLRNEILDKGKEEASDDTSNDTSRVTVIDEPSS